MDFFPATQLASMSASLQEAMPERVPADQPARGASGGPANKLYGLSACRLAI